MTNLIPTVAIVDGTPRASSLDIAEKFGKSHDQVLKVIRKIMTECPADFTAVNFDASAYTDNTGRTLPMYSLTRDAFSLVAMGFTGKEALAWKVKYIEAFNFMARELLAQQKSKRTRKALGSGVPACASPVLEPAVYLKGKRIFDMMSKLMTDFDLVKNHVMLWGRPGGRLARLSPEQESLYQNAVDASKVALCSLNQAQYALRISMQIQTMHSFDVR